MLTASYLLLLILELFENNKLVSKIRTFFMISLFNFDLYHDYRQSNHRKSNGQFTILRI